VDGRNPLFYRCIDLEAYVKEVEPHKENMLVINKADLLSEDIRNLWSDYLNKKGINHLFFSAKDEQLKIDTDKIAEDEEKIKAEELRENTPLVFTRHVLLAILKKMVTKIREVKHQAELEKKKDSKEEPETKKHPQADCITIGMVGYPNVGKSSVINVLCKKKLVGVGAMPGNGNLIIDFLISRCVMVFYLLIQSRTGLVQSSGSAEKSLNKSLNISINIISTSLTQLLLKSCKHLLNTEGRDCFQFP
jgi:ribosome biogenesis GTPase A